jgi:hypothetical protein
MISSRVMWERSEATLTPSARQVGDLRIVSSSD